jgi:hypothetical protein
MITYEKSGDVVKKIEIKEEVYSISELEKEIADLGTAIDSIEFMEYSDDNLIGIIDEYNYKKQLEKESLEDLKKDKELLLKELNG